MSTAVYIVFFVVLGILGLLAIICGSGDSIEPWMPTISRAIVFNLLIVGAALTYDRISRRPKRVRCRHCHFDLRGANDRCPRCGMEIPARTKP